MANRICTGFQQITDLSSAVTLTVPADTGRALIQSNGAAARWREDGTTPTASIGTLLKDGFDISMDGQLDKVQFIQVSASAILEVHYYNR